MNRLSRFKRNSNKDHWTALRRVMKYLRCTIDLGLCYGGYPNLLGGYFDTNWIFDLDETKFMNRFIFTLDGWKSSKQTCIARSTM